MRIKRNEESERHLSQQRKLSTMAVIDGDNYAFEIQLRSLNLTTVLKKCTGAFGNERKYNN